MAEKAITPASESSIAKKEAEKVSKQALAIVIKTDDDLKAAITTLGQIKTTAKGIAAKKDSIIMPLNVSIREVRALFAEPESKLAEAERSLKAQILDYQRKLAAKAEKKAEKIEAKIDAGEMTLNQGMSKMAKIAQPQTTVKAESGAGIQVRKVRKVRIINMAEVPAIYFADPRVIESVRMAVSKDALATGNEGVVIPGVEVYTEESVAGI